MRLVALSDTHLAHGQVSVPDGDLLVHAGDATRRGKLEELAPFLDWMAALPHRHKVFVAGNHDSCCERDPEAVRGLTAVRGIHYLCDEALELEGLRLFGSPVTPWFRAMAFTQARGPVIAETWAKIPTGLDVLVTHGPPHRIGDRMVLGARVGCADLRERLRAARPKVHVFGHIHEAYGAYMDGELPETRFFNVATRRLLGGCNDPVVIEV